MRRLLGEARISGLTFSNRLVRSATWEGMADPAGNVTTKLSDFLCTLASGGVGLIISGYTYISPEGKQLPGQMGIYDSSSLEKLTKLAEDIHSLGGKIAVQLVHAGGQTTSKVTGITPLAPSSISIPQYQETPDAMTSEDIDRIISSFSLAASICKKTGIDAVQLHAAHGYLISQFLSPLANRREDKYGGNLDGRSRFLMETYRGVRGAVGDNYPVMVKLNGSDNLEGGFSVDEAVEVARMLDDEGIDAVEVSGGTPASGSRIPVRTGIDSREKEAYNLPEAVRIKNSVQCPVIVVGGFRSFELADGVIRRGEADFVAMSRPFIREPFLPRRWSEGNENHAHCISCNGCFRPGLKEGGIYCVVDKLEQDNRNLTL